MKLWFRILAPKIMIPIWLICQNDPEFIAVLISNRKLVLLSFSYWEKNKDKFLLIVGMLFLHVWSAKTSFWYICLRQLYSLKYCFKIGFCWIFPTFSDIVSWQKVQQKIKKSLLKTPKTSVLLKLLFSPGLENEFSSAGENKSG